MKGFLLPHQKSQLLQFLQQLPTGKFLVKVEEYHPKRSLEQNARLWAILQDIAEQVPDETGKLYGPETWLEFFKAEFLGKDVMVIDGQPRAIPKRSSRLRVVEFGDLMMQIESWAVDHGVVFKNEEAA